MYKGGEERGRRGERGRRKGGEERGGGGEKITVPVPPSELDLASPVVKMLVQLS